MLIDSELVGPVSLVGAGGPMHGELPHTTPSSNDDTLVVDARGVEEWIVRPPSPGRALHVYRVAAGDWLVSEVGRANEGRGADVEQALTALAEVQEPARWWRAVPRALEDADADGPMERPSLELPERR